MNNIYDEYKKLEDGMSIVRRGWYWGFLDTRGRLIAYWFAWVKPFVDGWALVHEPCESTYLINKAGCPMTVNGEYLTDAYQFYNGKTLVEIKNKEWYVVDKRGCILTEPFENYYRNVRNDENFLYIYKGNAWGILNMLERNIVVPCVFNRDDDGIEEFNIEKKLIIVYTSHCQAENKYDCKGSTEVYKIFKLDSGKTTIDYFDEYEWLNDNILIRIDNMWGCLNADLEYIVLPVCSDKQSVIDELLYKE